MEDLLNILFDKISNTDEVINEMYKNIQTITLFLKVMIKGHTSTTMQIYKKFEGLVYKLIDAIQASMVDGDKEMNNNSEKFYVCIGDTNTKLKLFTIYVTLYYTKSIFANKKSFVGIDYEFNNRKIALMQLCFNVPEQTSPNVMWIINPSELDGVELGILVDFLMIRLSIYKILHGCDSLDAPYMYQQMFQNDTKKIQKFTSRVIDTRFLCEYYKLMQGPEKKCSIYDALLFFKTISEEKYKALNEISDMAGPIQDISWNVHKLSSFNVKYAYYDVLFLKRFLFDIFKVAKETMPNKYKSFKYIPVITRFVLQEKHELSHIVADAKKDIDPINNYLIKQHETNVTLVTIFNKVIENLILKEFNCNINDILAITFIKTPFMLILKKIVYYLTTTQFTTYINKNEIYKATFSLNKMYDDMNSVKYYRFVKFLKVFEKDATEKILMLYK